MRDSRRDGAQEREWAALRFRERKSSPGSLRCPLDVVFRCAAFGHVKCDDGRPSLARAIVQLAHTLGLTTIAEGVESQDQLTPLRDLQCQLAQDYHRGMPLDALETEDLLRALAS